MLTVYKSMKNNSNKEIKNVNLKRKKRQLIKVGALHI